MKDLFIISCASLIFTLNSFGQDFTKLKEKEIDNGKVRFAQEFANSFFTSLKNGSFYEFKNEAIDAVKVQLTEANQKSIYKGLKEQFGDYQSQSFAEAWLQKGVTGNCLYRFKGIFSKSFKKLEIRVVLDNSGKIAGFWILPWSDMLK